MNRLKNKLLFIIERLLLKGVGYQFLLIAIAIGIISFSAGFLLQITDPGIKNIGDAAWWAFLRLSDPGYLGDDQGLIKRIISTIVTILGYVVFLGSLVAILTHWLNSKMRKLESGLTPIIQRGHFLILGWTNRTKIIVKEILSSEGSVKKFLQHIKRSRLRIVILAEDVNMETVHELREELGPLWSDRIITFRTGNPLRIDDLVRVDMPNAGVIIIPGSSFVYGGSENTDIRALKIIMSISNLILDMPNPPPIIITEVHDARKTTILESAYHGTIESVVGDSFISRLITQNIRHIGLSEIYSEILSHEGNELYIIENHTLAQNRFCDIIGCFPMAIIVGVIQYDKEHHTPLLNPDPDYILQKQDHLIVLAQDFPASKHMTQPAGTHQTPASPIRTEKTFKTKKILILGWSNKVPALLDDLEKYQHDKFIVDHVSTLPEHTRLKSLKRYRTATQNIETNFIEDDYTLPSFYQKNDISSYSNIIMLANDRLDTGEESDARTIMGYMILRRNFSQKTRETGILIELMDPDNRNLIHTDFAEVINSPMIISNMLAQVALRTELNSIFNTLFSSHGAEIILRSAECYHLLNRDMLFSEIELGVYSKNDIAIGLKIQSEDISTNRYILNPQKDSLWKLTKNDYIVVLSKDTI